MKKLKDFNLFNVTLYFEDGNIKKETCLSESEEIAIVYFEQEYGDTLVDVHVNEVPNGGKAE